MGGCPHLVFPVLAQFAAGFCGGVGEIAAAGGGRLLLPVSVPVSEPGERHAGGDGAHRFGGRQVPSRLIQQLRRPPGETSGIMQQVIPALRSPAFKEEM